MKDYCKINFDTELVRIKNDHKIEIEKLKKEYEKINLEKTNSVRINVKKK